MKPAGTITVLLAASALGGCALLETTRSFLFDSTDEVTRRQLERVAKDWSLTIRASQVIPVYPLTEDLQPGDLFLVTRTTADQHEEYVERGFLSLPQHVGRLTDLDYARSYERAFGIGAHDDTPHHWQFPAVGAKGWDEAPRAFFPSYTFSVRRGSGARIALPAQSVPIGLGLLQADAVDGTVVLSDAKVYGLPLEDLWQPVQDWARTPHFQELLADARGGEERPAFLRAITRVYLIGAIDVSLVDASSGAGGFDVGLAPEIELLESPSTDAAAAYTAARKAVEEQLLGRDGAGVPGAAAGAGALDAGGSVRFSQISRRSVTAEETFGRPLVVGYLAFDFPIRARGELGNPLETRAVLEQGREPADGPALGDYSAAQLGMAAAKRRINALPAAERDALYRAAAERLGAAFQERFAARLAQPGGDGANAFTHATNTWPDLTPAEVDRRVAAALRAALTEEH